MDANSLITSQIAAATACSYIIRLLQDWKKIPWVTEHSTAINTAMRIGLAGIATLGITKAWEGSLTAGGTLTITIPPLAIMLHGLWHWFSQYTLTHLAGTAIEKKPAAPPNA